MAAPIDVINPLSKRQISQVEAALSNLEHRDFCGAPYEADQSPAC
ncbi:hypothetical protein BLA23254_04649 [Burkholderia lata]|uniref:Uncharacterized protein n=1 Tax=Burkholderia lata (strain ATCC 17760 / DSM 23089 / LMG 22485 / NCIMB 9086 / R18194 / 383) TaxID=482957 RepID=A0A6P2NSC6_BURL3|nr:hypothetical protein [Burkholderia lata]VWB97808.1 hypothetical protein BLA23254_04649 [Burkholderia lata]